MLVKWLFYTLNSTTSQQKKERRNIKIKRIIVHRRQHLKLSDNSTSINTCRVFSRNRYQEKWAASSIRYPQVFSAFFSSNETDLKEGSDPIFIGFKGLLLEKKLFRNRTLSPGKLLGRLLTVFESDSNTKGR